MPATIPQTRPLVLLLLPSLSLLSCGSSSAVLLVPVGRVELLPVAVGAVGGVALLVLVGVMLAGVGESALLVAVRSCNGSYGVVVHGGCAWVLSGCSALLPIVQLHGGALVLHTSRSVRCSSPPHTVPVRLVHAPHSYV